MPITIVKENTFSVIKSAVDKTVDLIAPTFGPSSNKVIISKVTHGFVLDDGVQIARDLELDDPAENAVMKVVRETAIRTNDRVGDGTTGALILLQAIIAEISKKRNRNNRKIEQELKTALEECKDQLLKQSKEIKTKDDLLKVARISFDDAHIVELIADAWFKLGKNGVLTIDRSGTMETFVDLANGIKINNGYMSPHMITNPQRMEGVIEKPYILLTDFRLTEVSDVLGIMEKLAEKKVNSLVIIAEHIEQNALATLIINKMQGKFNTIAIANKGAYLEDIALMTGAKVFSKDKGDKLEEATIEDLGRAERFIAKTTESIIVKPKGDKKVVQKAKDDLKEAINLEKIDKVKTAIKERLARFENKVGVIKVGASTDNELNALRYKVEDAINATQAAYNGGVVRGGGVSLANLKTSSEILNTALQAPFKHLKNNSGIDSHRELKENEALNVVTGEVGDWIKVGVMDPVNVIIAQIESAISIASLLITTSGIIVEPPREIPMEK